jgi:hypothetical protein
MWEPPPRPSSRAQRGAGAIDKPFLSLQAIVFGTLCVPQSANSASCCRNLDPVGYNFGYSREGFGSGADLG